MKSRIYKLSFVLLLGAASAHAAYTDTETTGQGLSTWQKLTSTVKVKVDEWVNYWKGEATPAAPAPTEVVKAQPVGTGTTAPAAAVAPATEQAPTAAATAPAASQAPAKSVAQAAPAKPAKPGLSDENVALRKQKMFESDAKGSSLQQIKQLKDSFKQAPVLKVAKPARAGTSKLARSKEGVPVANWNQVKVSKVVPRLDIGSEALISKEDFTMEKVQISAGNPSQLKKLTSPAPISAQELAKLTGIQPVKAFGAKGLQANIRTVGAPVSLETIQKITYAIKENGEIKLAPYKPMTDEELKMVAALILFERGDHCHMIMGLFHQLQAEPKNKSEATYYLGACADKLKMEQVAFDNLSALVGKEDKEFGADALELLAKDLPLIYEKDFYTVLKGVKSFKDLVTEKSQDNVSYRMAKGAYRAADYKTSISYATRVNSGSEFYDEARFLSAMNSFALADKPAALKKLQDLRDSLEARKVQDKNIRALVSVNLARMHFGLKQYDKAHEAYMQVPKDHPLWVQALIEQGWTQLALEDNSGAIGNMYSLHSPYFKAVYQPESFVVRTIGYLQICQYGDAYKTLTWMEKDYRDMYDKTQTYLSNRSEPNDIYASVKAYIKGKSTDTVEGVPYQVWREMAHRKDFLNLQTALNEKQDEAHRYDGVNTKIKDEKASIRWRAEQSKKRFDDFRGKIAKVSKDKGLTKNLGDYEKGLKREKDLTIGYRFQLQVLELSRQGFLDFQSKSQHKLDTETASLTTRAGKTLMSHAKDMTKQMSSMLENNEFLRYEVFSGSGENIRYQVAGGAVGGNPNRVPASIKPQKMMNWNFDGEFWEDEIGSYRSSLQNVCPTSMTKQATAVDEEN